MEAALKLPVEYSLISSKALAGILIPAYNIPINSSVMFIHQGINDTYLITSRDNRFILRIYRVNWKSFDEVKAELDLLLFLNENGLSVSYPLSDKSGNFIQRIDCPEGIRFAVIFTHASGESLSSLNPQHANLFGQYMARFHQLTENFKLEKLSRDYTVNGILTNTINSLRSLPNNSGGAYSKFEKMRYQLQEKLPTKTLKDVRAGICHGDPHYENIFIENSLGKITLFDFDFCGHGYLLYDLGSFYRYERNSQENKDSFFEGYEMIRPLNQTEKELLPYFEVLMRIFHLGARAKNADGIKNPKWLQTDIEKTIVDIDEQVAKIGK